jgi:hypothetical protein
MLAAIASALETPIDYQQAAVGAVLLAFILQWRSTSRRTVRTYINCTEWEYAKDLSVFRIPEEQIMATAAAGAFRQHVMPGEVNCHSGIFCRVSRETSKIRSRVLLQITKRRLPDSATINGTNTEIPEAGFLWMLSENAANEGACDNNPTCTVSQCSVS